MLTPRTTSGAADSARRAASRRATTSAPSLLKPIRLTTARSAGSRNSRGCGLPGCGSPVTVPISTWPKPSARQRVDADGVLVEAGGQPERGAGRSAPAPADRRVARRTARAPCSRARRPDRPERQVVRPLRVDPGEDVVEEDVVRRHRSARSPCRAAHAAQSCSDRTPMSPRLQRLDALHGGAEPLDRGDARDVGRAPRRCGSRSRRARASRRWSTPCGVLMTRSISPSRISCDGGRLAVRALALEVLAHDRGRDAVAAQHLGGALGGEDLEAEVGEPLDREDHRALVAVGHRDEDPPRGRQRAERRRPGTWRTRCRSRRRSPSPRRSSASPGRARCRPCCRRGVRNRLNGITASLTAIGASAGRSPPSPVGRQHARGAQRRRSTRRASPGPPPWPAAPRSPWRRTARSATARGLASRT